MKKVAFETAAQNWRLFKWPVARSLPTDDKPLSSGADRVAARHGNRLDSPSSTKRKGARFVSASVRRPPSRAARCTWQRRLRRRRRRQRAVRRRELRRASGDTSRGERTRIEMIDDARLTIAHLAAEPTASGAATPQRRRLRRSRWSWRRTRWR